MVTPALKWRKSSYSGNTGGNCVEVAIDGGRVLIRDSKYRRAASNDPAFEPIITITVGQWEELLKVATGGTHAVIEPAIVVGHDGRVELCAADGTTLGFTSSEWAAFTSGAEAGEFGRSALAA